MARGTIEAKLTLSTSLYKAGLAQALKDAKAFSASLGSTAKITLPAPQTTGLKAASAALREQNDLVRKARDDVSNLRVAYERGDTSRADFIRDTKDLDREIIQLRDSLKEMPTAVAGLNRALGTNARGLQTAQGQVSKLGLSQQVLIGTNQELAQSLAGSGRLGSVASVGIAAYGGGLGVASTGALALGGAVLGVGVGTAALVQRGIPQVKSFQNSINILSESGAKDLDRLDSRLADLQKQAGRAGRAFSRSELAAALADTVKAGASADEAFRILSESVKLAAAEGTNLSASTALVLKGLRQYQLGAEDAGKVTDQLAQGGLLAAGTAEDISIGLSRVAGTGRAAGVEMSDLIGLIVELDNAGLDARDRGANALNSALSALAGLTPKARTQLAAWNIEVDNTDGSARKAGDILKDLGDKLRTAGIQYDESTDSLTGNGDALRGLANIMGTEGARAVLNLTGKWREYAAEVKNSDGVSQSYSDTMTQGLEPAQRRAQAALDDLGKSVAQVFTPAMEGAATALDAVARQLDSISNKPLSFGNVVDAIIGADGAERLQTANDDIASTKRALEEVRAALSDSKNTTVTTERTGLLGLGGLDKGEVDRFVADGEQQLQLLESKLKTLQARRDDVLAQYGLGGGGAGGSSGGRAGSKKNTPEARNIVPEVSAEFDQGLADYIKALQDAEDSAAAAQVGAMENGAAKVQARRQLDLQQAQRAFDDQVVGLKEGSERYNGFLAAFNTETQAINTRANRDLEADADTKLKTAQTLRERIDRVSSDLSNAQARGIDNPIKAIAGQFRVTSQAIKKETDDLLTGVASALQEGAVSAEEAQALILQINADARGREVQAERTKSAEIRKFQTERKAEAVKLAEETQKAVAEVLGQQAKALSDAQIASLDGTIPQLQATFKAEQDERARNFEATLEGFKGSNTERIGLAKSYNATEALLSRQHQVQLNQQERTALESYLTTLKDYEAQVAQARQKARQDEIANAQALNTARAASAQGQIDAGDTSGYAALIAVQQDAVRIAKELTQATRERGASASEIVSALSAEAEAQKGVVGAVQGQIDALKTLRDKQLEVVNSGSQVLEYARAAAELSGTDFNENDAGAAIRAQVEAQAALFQAQVEANKPLAERLETLKLIQQSEKELADLGQQSGLTSEDRQLISEDSAASLAAYPEQAATALEQIGSLDASIAALGVTLQGATGELQTLLEAAGSDEGLNVTVKVQIDRGALDAAEQTLRETFGEAAGNRIVEASTNAGTRAGAGLIGAFTSGITRNRSGLLAEVDRLLQQVRNRLPSSDAKVGWLSDLTYSGSKLPETFAKGMIKGKGSVISAADVISRAAKPSVMVPNIPTSRPLSYSGAGDGAGGSPTTYNLQIDGRNGGQTTGLLGMSARQLARDVERELRVRQT